MATSHTFKELLQERRLVKAKELLEGTERINKAKFGQTPKEFKEQQFLMYH
jgi:methylphosphotriester-DNA--protein-cysteine methyltransferase